MAAPGKRRAYDLDWVCANYALTDPNLWQIVTDCRVELFEFPE
jgi:hypothetical protein